MKRRLTYIKDKIDYINNLENKINSLENKIIILENMILKDRYKIKENEIPNIKSIVENLFNEDFENLR